MIAVKLTTMHHSTWKKRTEISNHFRFFSVSSWLSSRQFEFETCATSSPSTKFRFKSKLAFESKRSHPVEKKVLALATSYEPFFSVYNKFKNSRHEPFCCHRIFQIFFVKLSYKNEWKSLCSRNHKWKTNLEIWAIYQTSATSFLVRKNIAVSILKRCWSYANTYVFREIISRG